MQRIHMLCWPRRRRRRRPGQQALLAAERPASLGVQCVGSKASQPTMPAPLLQPYPKHFENYRHTVLVIPVRNPYDWLMAMHGTCYCCTSMELQRWVGSSGDSACEQHHRASSHHTIVWEGVPGQAAWSMRAGKACPD